MAALRLLVRLAQEEARLCGAVFPAAEQAGVLSQVGWGRGELGGAGGFLLVLATKVAKLAFLGTKKLEGCTKAGPACPARPPPFL